MFLLAVLDSEGFLEYDLSLSFLVLGMCRLFFLIDEVIHVEEEILDLIVDFAIDLSGAIDLEPVEFFFEEYEFD